MNCSLIIPAAGSGSRFGATVPKQLLPLRGRAILRRSLDAFAGLVDEAVVAVSEATRAAVAEMLAQEPSPFPVRLVAGGSTRQDSVRSALAACAGELVLIHDAVRPLVPRRCIVDCLAALADHDAALVAVPCHATVKRSGDGSRVEATVPRDGLWLAQTPQGVRRLPALAAFARAAAEGWRCSDDAEVMERSGHAVALVMGDARNFKLTTPDDLAVAEALLDRDGIGAPAPRCAAH
jgi:2-C-methyl-D-erythritol 4-phosphate cytidylyltransferase